MGNLEDKMRNMRGDVSRAVSGNAHTPPTKAHNTPASTAKSVNTVVNNFQNSIREKTMQMSNQVAGGQDVPQITSSGADTNQMVINSRGELTFKHMEGGVSKTSPMKILATLKFGTERSGSLVGNNQIAQRIQDAMIRSIQNALSHFASAGYTPMKLMTNAAEVSEYIIRQNSPLWGSIKVSNPQIIFSTISVDNGSPAPVASKQTAVQSNYDGPQITAAGVGYNQLMINSTDELTFKQTEGGITKEVPMKVRATLKFSTERSGNLAGDNTIAERINNSIIRSIQNALNHFAAEGYTPMKLMTNVAEVSDYIIRQNSPLWGSIKAAEPQITFSTIAPDRDQGSAPSAAPVSKVGTPLGNKPGSQGSGFSKIGAAAGVAAGANKVATPTGKIGTPAGKIGTPAGKIGTPPSHSTASTSSNSVMQKVMAEKKAIEDKKNASSVANRMGAASADHSANWRCSSCGAKNTGRFCSSCGSPAK